MVGTLDDYTIAFRATLRSQQSTALVGYDVGEPLIEIAILEIPRSASSVRVAFVAVCEVFRMAVEMAEGANCLIAIVPDNESVKRRLERNEHFNRIGEYPFPYFATLPDVRGLRDRICRN